MVSLSGSFEALLAGRAIQGFGTSLRYIVLNNTSAEDRVVSQGMLTIFTSIGQITGTAVIGILMVSTTTGVSGTVFRGVVVLLSAMLILSLWLEGKPPASPAFKTEVTEEGY